MVEIDPPHEPILATPPAARAKPAGDPPAVLSAPRPAAARRSRVLELCGPRSEGPRRRPLGRRGGRSEQVAVLSAVEEQVAKMRCFGRLAYQQFSEIQPLALLWCLKSRRVWKPRSRHHDVVVSRVFRTADEQL